MREKPDQHAESTSNARRIARSTPTRGPSCASSRTGPATLHLPDAGTQPSDQQYEQTGQMPHLRHDAHSRDGKAPPSPSRATSRAAEATERAALDHPCSTHHRFFAQEQVHRPARDAGAGARRRLRRCATSRSTPFPTSRTCRSSSTPSGQARRRRSSRTRSPIPSRPRCSRCRKAKVVRGYSFYGFSFVYVIFEDGTDPYWARSRVLEYLSGLSGSLPQGRHAHRSARTRPASAGRSCIRINSTNRDLAELRSMQDWYLQIPTHLRGGRVRSRLRRRFREAIPGHGGSRPSCAPTTSRSRDVSMAIERSNGEVGGRSIELAEKEFILRVRGYVAEPGRLAKSRRRRRAQAACRFCWATSPTCSSARTCGAASPS